MRWKKALFPVTTMLAGLSDVTPSGVGCIAPVSATTVTPPEREP